MCHVSSSGGNQVSSQNKSTQVDLFLVKINSFSDDTRSSVKYVYGKDLSKLLQQLWFLPQSKFSVIRFFEYIGW